MTDIIDSIAIKKDDMQDGSREIDPFPQGNPKIYSIGDSWTVTLSTDGVSGTISASSLFEKFFKKIHETILPVSEELGFTK